MIFRNNNSITEELQMQNRYVWEEVAVGLKRIKVFINNQASSSVKHLFVLVTEDNQVIKFKFRVNSCAEYGIFTIPCKNGVMGHPMFYSQTTFTGNSFIYIGTIHSPIKFKRSVILKDIHNSSYSGLCKGKFHKRGINIIFIFYSLLLWLFLY